MKLSKLLKAKGTVKPKTGSTRFEIIGDKVTIHHSQSFKQSHNWQSADVTHGVTITVAAKDQKAATEWIQGEVEAIVISKSREQESFLLSLATSKEGK